MTKTILIVQQSTRGQSVRYYGDLTESMNALSNVVAAAVMNMAAGGTPEDDIKKQIAICTEYGTTEGLRRAHEIKGGTKS